MSNFYFTQKQLPWRSISPHAVVFDSHGKRYWRPCCVAQFDSRGKKHWRPCCDVQFCNLPCSHPFQAAFSQPAHSLVSVFPLCICFHCPHSNDSSCCCCGSCTHLHLSSWVPALSRILSGCCGLGEDTVFAVRELTAITPWCDPLSACAAILPVSSARSLITVGSYSCPAQICTWKPLLLFRQAFHGFMTFCISIGVFCAVLSFLCALFQAACVTVLVIISCEGWGWVGKLSAYKTQRLSPCASVWYLSVLSEIVYQLAILWGQLSKVFSEFSPRTCLSWVVNSVA